MKLKHLMSATMVAVAVLFGSAGPLQAQLTATAGIAPIPVVEDFSGVPTGEVSGVLSIASAAIGEAFVGQTVDGGGGDSFEFFLGTPSSPLVLATPASSDGISVVSGVFVAGLADGTGPRDFGEGWSPFCLKYLRRLSA